MRRAAIKTFAVLLLLRGLSNFLKPLTDTVGFIFFGVELKGIANAILSPLFGVYMLATAYALWTRHRAAVPLAIGYAAYVSISMPLYNLFNPTPHTLGFALFTAFMIGMPWGVVWLLRRGETSVPGPSSLVTGLPTRD
jgi:hypothetical protein